MERMDIIIKLMVLYLRAISLPLHRREKCEPAISRSMDKKSIMTTNFELDIHQGCETDVNRASNLIS